VSDWARVAVGGLLIGTIRAYQLLLSPFFAGCCRFVPSCSEYAALAIERHGPLRGGLQSLGRLLRCHPFHAGGVDLP
jgi:putative membrane protein insertion efficiency factor